MSFLVTKMIKKFEKYLTKKNLNFSNIDNSLYFLIKNQDLRSDEIDIISVQEKCSKGTFKISMTTVLKADPSQPMPSSTNIREFENGEELILDYKPYEPDLNEIKNLLGIEYKESTSFFERLFVWFIYAVRVKEKCETSLQKMEINFDELELISFYKFYQGNFCFDFSLGIEKKCSIMFKVFGYKGDVLGIAVQLTRLSTGELDTVFLITHNQLKYYQPKNLSSNKKIKMARRVETVLAKKFYFENYGFMKILEKVIYPILRHGKLAKPLNDGEKALRKNKVSENRIYKFWPIRKFFF